ncbi:MAG: enoyl-CoA hydratase/isomerase family protein [Chloroflexi bacterium]|nr:enoyl-CoA hydratase/isomerase family protein [Chloroflexota bacterium]
MDLKDVLYEVHDHVATITLNRPDRLNALGGSLGPDLEAALKTARSADEVRVVVLTGAGKAFCSGLDLKERSERPKARTVANWLRGLEVPRIALGMNKPLIAAVNGAAVGFGFELAMLCDYRIGSEDARMGDAHVKRGLIQDCAAIYTLPRVVGWANACKVLLTGELFPAAELKDLGVLNEVVPAGQSLAAAKAFAQRIACNAPLAVQMTKRLMLMAQRGQLDDVVDYSFLMMGMMQQTEDSVEGIKSFLEKRQPQFKGK